MALVVNSNVPSIAAQRYLMESRNEMETAMERLSSGKRINSAADDASGLAIATRMDTQVRGLNAAIKNANDGISLVQTAEGAMQEVTDMLQRMRELSLQAVHGTNSDSDRAALDAEVQELIAEIDRVSSATAFNNQAILDGSFNQLFQIGAKMGETVRISVNAMDSASLGLGEATEDSSSSNVDTLVSARLANTFSWDPDSNTTANGYTSTSITGLSFAAGDIEINGQALGAFNGVNDDLYDLTKNINDNVDNVIASAFNTAVAKSVGTGVASENQIAIKVGAVGTSSESWYQPETVRALGASNSMAELVANINNAFSNNEVVASINSDGKLVLSNDTGATIQIADDSGTNGAYDGATGFLVDTDAVISAAGSSLYQTGVQGFLRIESTDGTAIEIDEGNLGLTSPGSRTDIQNIGLNKTSEDPTGINYTVTGIDLTAAQASAAMGKSTTTDQADLTINGVEIYDDTLATASNSFQGKLDLINAFSDETEVVASAYYERTFDTTNWNLVKGDTFDLNGTTITISATVVSTVAAINAQTANTGIVATQSGSNVTLKGDGVQSITIGQNDYTISASTHDAQSVRTADTALTARRISLASADMITGRVLTLTIADNDPDGVLGGNTLLSIAAGASLTFYHTVTSSQTVGDVHKAFRDALVAHYHSTNSTQAGTAEAFFALSGATAGDVHAIGFASGAGLGEFDITFGIDQTADASRIFYNGTDQGASQTLASYTDVGALRLVSTNGEPISLEFNEDGSALGLTEMNVGDTTFDANTATLSVASSTGTSVAGLSIATSAGAESALTVLDTALQEVSDARANLGALENRLGHTVSNLANVVENTTAARSRIEDADFALEAANLARAQILQQAGTAMLAQANAAPQNVLSLLG